MAANALKYEDQKRLMLIANIKRNQELKMLTDDDVALKVRMNKRTYQAKKNPKNKDRYFTQPEMVRLFKVLGFTEAQKAESL